MAVFETWLRNDLKKPMRVVELSGNLFSADNGGNLIGVEVLDGGQAASLSGSVNGYVIRADGATVLINGTLSGNRASIVLPASAYAVIGQVSIVIKVGAVTVGACVAQVYRTTTDMIVDPANVIPSISELLAAIGDCEQATADANSAATLANTKAGLANTAASLANTKAGLADTAAANANTAASAANAAAGKIDNMTVAASSSSTPTATITEVEGHKHIAFGLVQGNPGKDFHIQKTFASIAAMQAYDPDQDPSASKVTANDFVMIDTGSVQDADTGKLFCYEPETQDIWRYIGDLSGSQGIKGETGTGIANIVLNADYTLTITMDDGSTSYTTGSIRGAQGDPGPTGPAAYVHIRYSAVQPTQDSDMSTTPNDWMGIYSGAASTAPTAYTDYAWYKIKGETGSASNVYGNTIDMSSSDSTKVATAIGNKADKVSNAASGNFAGLDTNGNLTDSGKKASDFVSVYQGTENYGCFMRVGSDGNLALVLLAIMQAATSSTDGSVGLVPKPSAGDQGKFLRGDATWANPSAMSGATASVAGAAGLVPAPSAGDQNKVLKGDGTWGTAQQSNLMPSTAFSIPSVGDSVTYLMTGMTASYQLIRWNFSVSAENNPPASLEWTTGAGSFTITNTAGTTSETIQPVFAIADAIAIEEYIQQ